MDVAQGLTGARWLLNRVVYRPGQRAGHYESFYQRANHPDRPLAFWIRYTIFAPAADPGRAVGELWAVAFDGETNNHAVAKAEIPIQECEFDENDFGVRIGTATLGPHALRGSAGELQWDLRYDGDAPPVLLLPPKLYSSRFPKAKSLVALPLARYAGSYRAGRHEIAVEGWTGSQNHNWGSRHTDRYAFGQVAGFDAMPDSFLEVATAKTTIAGPVSAPWVTSLVLRHRGIEHSLVSARRAIRARAAYRCFEWDFTTGDDTVEITGRISAEPAAFIGLAYRNPPGGTKDCLNTKIATAEVTISDRRTGASETLRARSRALFEILTSRTDHGVQIRA